MRAKKVFEKFQEDSDPIDDLGISSFRKHVNFTAKYVFYDYLLKIIPKVLNTNTIPENILGGNGYIDDYVYTLLSTYIETYLTYKGKNIITVDNIRWPYELRQILLKKGYVPRMHFEEDKIK